MKLIGLLGGTSWPSTPLYYERINRLVSERLGGFHSARIVLYSVDYHQFKGRYHDGWAEMPALLRQELQTLCGMGAECVLLCNNTLHKAYDLMGSSLPVPFFHVIDLTIDHARKHGLGKLLFLATRFTMEDDFFTGALRKAGLDVTIPTESERAEIQAIQSQLAAGVSDPAHREYFTRLITRYPDCDAIVLACTELPLAIDGSLTGKPLINTIDLQCEAAVAFALDDV